MLKELAVYLGTQNGGVILCVVGALLLLAVGSVLVLIGKRDRVDSLLMAFFFIELSAAFIFLSFGFEDMEEAESNPRLVPLLWSISLFLCSIMQFVRVYVKKDYKPVQYGHVGNVALVLAVVVVTLLLFNRLGFFVSTGLMLLALMTVMGERRKVLMVSTAGVWMFATWAIFNKLLLLGLPVGTLFTK